MSLRRFVPALSAVVLGASLANLPSSFAAEEPAFVVTKPDELKWMPNPAGEGPEIAVVYGDPQKPGFYIIRARFKPGVMSHPHTHPNDRHVTVLSGTWWAGTGKTFDPSKTVPMKPGTYMMHPAGAAHFDGAKDEEAIVEIKGMGPAPSVPVKQ